MSLTSRLKSAYNAFFGRPVGSLRFGVELHKCAECDKKKPENLVFYICDRKACDPCGNPDCKHTLNIKHAKNFKSNEELGMNNGFHDYWEQEEPEIRDGSSYFLTPEDTAVTLAECPVGLFEYNGTLGMKTEYMTPRGPDGYVIDAYIVSSGERFCIKSDAMVNPCSIWTAEDGDE